MVLSTYRGGDDVVFVCEHVCCPSFFKQRWSEAGGQLRGLAERWPYCVRSLLQDTFSSLLPLASPGHGHHLGSLFAGGIQHSALHSSLESRQILHRTTKCY